MFIFIILEEYRLQVKIYIHKYYEVFSFLNFNISPRGDSTGESTILSIKGLWGSECFHLPPLYHILYLPRPSQFLLALTLSLGNIILSKKEQVSLMNVVSTRLKYIHRNDSHSWKEFSIFQLSYAFLFFYFPFFLFLFHFYLLWESCSGEILSPTRWNMRRIIFVDAFSHGSLNCIA